MNQQNIFYSWQTDTNESLNRYFIEDCLKRAIKKLNREDLSDLVIDRDTKNVPGMPDIGHTILEKITKSTVVVADLTIINPSSVRRPQERPVSNPNVLFELGYAFGTLGPKAMVGVFNTTSGKIEELPFDLRPKRLMTYRLAVGDDKVGVRMKLVNDLTDAIRQCLGDTEDDQIRRISRIYGVLSELWLFGTEIDEWYGIKSLLEVIQRQLAAAQELPALMVKSSFSDDALGRVNYIIGSLESAATIVLNEENWPKIKDHISSAANTINIILHFQRIKIDPSYHDELVRRTAAIPAELDEYLENLQNGELHRLDLEKLAHELRLIAFKPLVPQHPHFTVELKEISLDFRLNILRWAKNTPKNVEAIEVVKDIRGRLAQLISKYGLS
ncbi:MAG: hypothetical protein H6631_13240 [Anaerolineaceae bacterium]|nr:hypothetical protein [Anaerolineaceae bacterium]MCB9098268.1 hypothetical protein [Anaerolineales bacterium]